MKELKSSEVAKFSFRIDVRKQECVLEGIWDKIRKNAFLFLCFLLALSYHFPLRCSLQENRRLIFVRCKD
jgi:hypothetical protein